MEAVIISGMPAAGKTTTAKLVAKRLKLKVIGGTDILKEMAKEKGYATSGKNWWDTLTAVKFLKEREKNFEIDIETDRRLIEKAKAGNIVITSYTLPWLTAFGFKVWLSASPATRARHMAQRVGISASKARPILKVRDRENCLLYKKLYNIEFGKDTEPFDLILDTNKTTEKEVADQIILKLKQSRTGSI